MFLNGVVLEIKHKYGFLKRLEDQGAAVNFDPEIKSILNMENNCDQERKAILNQYQKGSKKLRPREIIGAQQLAGGLH